MMRREDWDDDDFFDWADQERIVRQEVKEETSDIESEFFNH